AAVKEVCGIELQRDLYSWVVLAGYMRLFSENFTKRLGGGPQGTVRAVNIHPSLLPAFPGVDSYAQAYAHGVKVTGCTVHLVDEELDHGPIVKQSVVPVLPGDTSETLSARILAEEHKTYTEAVALILSGQFHIEGRRIIES
ncbi:MAG: formyltransferase family protein, partial [Acidobacteriota bacterium]|nr:formyltransferase family protein [Acidobacteriota bacterium]